MNQPLSQDALNQIFLEARTFASNPNPWQDRAVSDAQLEQIWNLARMGPTAANSSPARVVFVRTPEAKARLKPALAAGNVDKTMNAPVTATSMWLFNTCAFHVVSSVGVPPVAILALRPRAMARKPIGAGLKIFIQPAVIVTESSQASGASVTHA